MVYRVCVEKKPGLAPECASLLSDCRSFLDLKSLENVRIWNRYDVEGIDETLFAYATNTVFSEPQLDLTSASRAILSNFGAPAKACKARFCGEDEKVWRSSQRSCWQDCLMNRRTFDVVPPIGIEPMTRGFSVPCSTD